MSSDYQLSQALGDLSECFTVPELCVLAEVCRARKTAGFGEVHIVWHNHFPDTIREVSSRKLTLLPRPKT